MSVETDIERITTLLQTILVEEVDVYIVKIKIVPANKYKIFLDADSGLSIETCTRIARKLRKYIEEMEWYPEGEYGLEVSSPGIDEPLILNRQYIKNINRAVEVTLNSDEVLTGKLLTVVDTEISLEMVEGKGSKAVKTIKTVLMEDIKKTIVQIIF
jgi:ribosome maturation factor RimP